MSFKLLPLNLDATLNLASAVEKLLLVQGKNELQFLEHKFSKVYTTPIVHITICQEATQSQISGEFLEVKERLRR